MQAWKDQTNNRLRRAWLPVAVMLWSFASTAVAESFVAAKKSGVKVYAEASKKAATVMTLKTGEELPMLERKGVYYQVKVQGKNAYVSAFDVKRSAGKQSSLAKQINSVYQASRGQDDMKAARGRTAVMGVRGLTSEDDAAGAAGAIPNYRFVYALEDMKIDENEIESFGKTLQR